MTDIDSLLPACEMLGALRAREISAAELLEAHLERIDRLNPALTAIVTQNREAARASARAADEKRARGEDGALLGLPLTIKDCVHVAGLPTTGGLLDRKDAVSQEDAPAAARLLKAGGVLVGKTNVPPYASDWQSDNPVFGRSNNPWNLDRTPGGSTGGGAAAVAAGLTPLELGGDFCGSIRIPAAFCGVYGHKPSIGPVPGTGHFPGDMLPNAATPIAVLGPLARHASDLDLALGVLAGAAVDEDGSDVRLPPPRSRRLRDFRVAILPPLSWQPVEGEIMDALDTLLSQLRGLSATVEVTQPEGFGDLRDYVHAYVAIISTISSSRLAPDERHWQAARCRALDDELLDAWADGLEMSAQTYIELFGKRERYRASLRSFFREWDVLISPANIVTAYEHMDAPFPDRLMDEECVLRIGGQTVVYDRQCVYPSLASYSGHPATAFPIGTGASGLPIGVQAVGPYLEDRTTIAFADLVARELGGYVPPPQFGPG